MDEPFSSLDYNLRSSLQELIKKLHKKKGVTILFVTHDRSEAFYLSDRIAIINQGEVTQLDTPHNLYFTPANLKVVEFLGERNIFPAQIKSGVLNCELFDIPFNKKDDSGYVILRAESMILKNTDDVGSPFHIKGKIEELSFLNGFYTVEVFVKNNCIYITQQGNGDFAFKCGDDVIIDINQKHVLFVKD